MTSMASADDADKGDLASLLAVYDGCISKVFVKAGVGLLSGGLASAIFFKRKRWPAVFGTAVGIGIAYADCQHSIEHPKFVRAFRIRSTETETLRLLSLRPLDEPTAHQQHQTPQVPAEPVIVVPSPQQGPAGGGGVASTDPTRHFQHHQQPTTVQQVSPGHAHTHTPAHLDPVAYRQQHEFYNAHRQYHHTYHYGAGQQQQPQQDQDASQDFHYQYPRQE